MGRPTTDMFKVNGTSMLAPDEEVEMSFEDIDSADTGRSEDGKMHRNVVRYKVGKWSFNYKMISDADYRTLEAMFPNSGTFTFTHPSRTNPNVTTTSTCYRSNYSITWKSKKNNKWRNYKFNIIEI